MAKKHFDFSDLDTKVRPQDDFFQFAGGEWLRRNPIPESESVWSRFHMARQQELRKTHSIFKELTAKKRLVKGSESQLVRDFYVSGMDTKTRNKLGLAPVEKILKKIDAIQTKEDLLKFIFSEHKNGDDYLWSHFVGQDDKDNASYIFHLTQGSLSLPDRDYYLKKDEQSEKIKKLFSAYIQDVLILSGVSKEGVEKRAQSILSLETKLARISMSRTDARDLEKTYNKMSIKALQSYAPGIPWKEYLKKLGVNKKVQKVLVLQPNYFKKLDLLLNTVPLSTWKAYLCFVTLNEAAPYLSQKWVNLSFSFNGQVLAGSKKIKPLWKRVSATLDNYIGEVVGKEYVARYFPKEAKEKINDLVDDLFVAYKKHIEEVDWMSSKTKKKALKKLARTTRKLGYPDKWKSYKGLRIEAGTYYENIIRAEAFEHKKNLAKLGKKVDRKEWFIPPQTVNAYCDLNNNEIVFPAGILQPPFFDPKGDAAINYGCMGSIIGHEMTHNFDDQGSRFDEKGDFKNWWSKEDKKQFDRRARVLVKQFNAYKVDELHVNGKLTLGENIADLGGLEIALDAFKVHLEKTDSAKTIQGFTSLERFFLGLAMFETEHSRKELRRMRLLTDPHSPGKYRVNGPFSNMDSFYEIFDVKPGDKLYRAPKDRAKIW